MGSLKRIMRGLGSLLVLVTLVAGSPLLLLTWVGNPWPPGGWAEMRLMTDQTLIGMAAVVLWAAWAQLTLSVIVETIAVVSGLRAPRLGRLFPGGQQRLVRSLVVSVAALGMGFMTATGTAGAAMAETAVSDVVHDPQDKASSSSGLVDLTLGHNATPWGVAQTYLGNGERWREVIDLNRGVKMADGTPLNENTPVIPTGTRIHLPADASVGSEQAADDEPGVSADESLRLLLVGTIGLAGGALAMSLHNRRRQLRERRSGRTISTPPESLASVERAVVEAGEQAIDEADFVDLALRHLAAGMRAARHPLPELGAVVLSDGEMTVLFATPQPRKPPEGWVVATDSRSWTLPRWWSLDPELRERQPAPYPAVVSVGRDNDGRTWMLDLEHIGTVTLAGSRADDLRRFVISELAVAPWAHGVEVLLSADAAQELIDLNPERLAETNIPDAERRARNHALDEPALEAYLRRDLLNLRRDAVAPDSTDSLVVAVSTNRASAEVHEARGRSRVVLISDGPTPTVEVEDHSATIVPWGVTVEPFLLRPAEGRHLAAWMRTTRNTADRPMPPSDDIRPLGTFINVDGSLREEYTRSRVADGGTSSLLPEHDDTYIEVTATTRDDLDALAPRVTEGLRTEIEALDPGLDEAVEAWHDPTSIRPRILTLGPVDVDPRNPNEVHIGNMGGTIEFILMLSTHERGVTAEQAAAAMCWSEGTVHNRARDARRLLGVDASGMPWLPNATSTPTAKRTGVPTYELHPDVLIADDLFRRLRARGQARGEEGLTDLIEALKLVEGRPFDRLRPGGYGWLVDSHPDVFLVGAIVDVAHLVATGCLANGDTQTAQWACEVAIGAAPHEDKARLDLAATLEASGRGPVNGLIVDEVVNQSDTDLPERTTRVLNRRGWS